MTFSPLPRLQSPAVAPASGVSLSSAGRGATFTAHPGPHEIRALDTAQDEHTPTGPPRCIWLTVAYSGATGHSVASPFYSNDDEGEHPFDGDGAMPSMAAFIAEEEDEGEHSPRCPQCGLPPAVDMEPGVCNQCGWEPTP